MGSGSELDKAESRAEGERSVEKAACSFLSRMPRSFSGDTAAEALAIGMASGGHVVVGSADGRARSMPIYVTLTTADSWRVEVLPASLAWQRFGLGPIEWAGLVGIALFVLVYCCEGPTTRPKLTP